MDDQFGRRTRPARRQSPGSRGLASAAGGVAEGIALEGDPPAPLADRIVRSRGRVMPAGARRTARALSVRHVASPPRGLRGAPDAPRGREHARADRGASAARSAARSVRPCTGRRRSRSRTVVSPSSCIRRSSSSSSTPREPVSAHGPRTCRAPTSPTVHGSEIRCCAGIPKRAMRGEGGPRACSAAAMPSAPSPPRRS